MSDIPLIESLIFERNALAARVAELEAALVQKPRRQQPPVEGREEIWHRAVVKTSEVSAVRVRLVRRPDCIAYMVLSPKGAPQACIAWKDNGKELEYKPFGDKPPAKSVYRPSAEEAVRLAETLRLDYERAAMLKECERLRRRESWCRSTAAQRLAEADALHARWAELWGEYQTRFNCADNQQVAL